ncbi:tetratricopeptide repeat protein [Maridesulfovibrio sp.]|uniref:tetratricopeptide repeat protein n=1 Tax=Maridesulfovibrio sp. TaxID=2795000 RepID=UPI003747D2F6
MMIGRGNLRPFFLLVVLLIAAFPSAAAAQQTPVKAFELAGMYQSSLNEKGTGWYALSDYVVFIADLERKNRDSSVRDMRAKAMLKVSELMRSWVASQSGKVDCDLSRWPERSRRILRKYLEQKIQIPSFGMFHGHVLENSPVQHRYRYAFAAPEVELKQFCARLKRVSAEPMCVFSQVLENMLKHDNYSVAAILLFDTDLPYLAACAVQEGESEKFCMVNYSMAPNPLAQRDALRKLLEGKLEIKPENLCRIPGSYEILSAMAESSMGSSPERAFAFLGLALPASGENYAEVVRKMNSLVEGRSISSIKRNYKNGVIVKMTMNSFGNLRFGEGIPDFDDGYFKQAVELFHKHGDKNTIAEFLIKAADKTPANYKVWDYLGAILKADKKWAQAAVVYLQFLQIRPFDSEALGHLAECYSQMGRTESAKVLADFLFYSGRVGDSIILKRITTQIRGQ